MEKSKPDFSIGYIPIYGKHILAPMDGVSDLPFRVLARQMGSAISVTEFINAMDVLNDNPNLIERTRYSEEERPIAFQIFDNDPDRILRAALSLCKLKPDILDVNFGCSVKKVSRRGAGAGLLLEPRKVENIIKSLSKSIDIPVTAKIRLGWDDNSRNYEMISRIIEENGGKLITVHGRTKAQGFSGSVDWDAIAKVKQAVNIPIVANGDVKSIYDVDRILNYTKCDAVMIGRAAIGNPWILNHIERNSVPPLEVLLVIKKHLLQSIDFYGVEKGMILFRKHLIRYITPYDISRECYEEIVRLTDPGKLFSILKKVIVS